MFYFDPRVYCWSCMEVVLLVFRLRIFSPVCASAQAKKKALAALNRQLQKAQDELHAQKKRRDDLGPQGIKLKESIKTLERQVNVKIEHPCS